MSLIESIANVSEGRRQVVIDACADALRRHGARLLDIHSDPSHNRSVFSFAGDPATLLEAASALYESAVAHIDLRHHRGVHPRVGAVDVVPFVPLAGATMAGCVELARTLGAAVAGRFRIPVFLYEEAASSPTRRSLAHVRRGQFEGLPARLAEPGWQPDFGPARPHPSAGATVIGARRPLIAYNVNLATDRLDVARDVARRVRESSGGLPWVRAMGVPLAHRGVVQVSMNLTNFERTPMEVAFARVEQEAARHGVAVLDSEIVGLVPAAALAATSPEDLRLANFTEDRVLEHRLLTA